MKKHILQAYGESNPVHPWGLRLRLSGIGGHQARVRSVSRSLAPGLQPNFLCCHIRLALGLYRTIPLLRQRLLAVLAL